MTRRYAVLGSLLAIIGFVAFVHATGSAPYAGLEQRDIKALSSAEVEDYLAGRGAGFAMAAELNHYPGPAHVLELSDALALSARQKARTQAIFADMRQAAVRLGAALVEKERELDRRFAGATITPEDLRRLVHEIAELQAQLRHVHLRAHLQQRAVLTSDQAERYDRWRGYTVTDSAPSSHRH